MEAVQIKHSDKGGYYTLTIGKEIIGNYDTFSEAVDALDEPENVQKVMEANQK